MTSNVVPTPDLSEALGRLQQMFPNIDLGSLTIDEHMVQRRILPSQVTEIVTVPFRYSVRASALAKGRSAYVALSSFEGFSKLRETYDLAKSLPINLEFTHIDNALDDVIHVGSNLTQLYFQMGMKHWGQDIVGPHKVSAAAEIKQLFPTRMAYELVRLAQHLGNLTLENLAHDPDVIHVNEYWVLVPHCSYLIDVITPHTSKEWPMHALRPSGTTDAKCLFFYLVRKAMIEAAIEDLNKTSPDPLLSHFTPKTVHRADLDKVMLFVGSTPKTPTIGEKEDAMDIDQTQAEPEVTVQGNLKVALVRKDAGPLFCLGTRYCTTLPSVSPQDQ